LPVFRIGGEFGGIIQLLYTFTQLIDKWKNILIMTAKANTKKEVTTSASENENVKDSCFIIVPIGANNSSTRRRTDGIIEAAIKPVLAKYNFTPVPAHQITDTGSITHGIIEHILEDRLVIADITELNPNVMYELAVRHCAAKPIITIAEEGTKLPFDIADQRTVFYINDARGIIDLQDQLDKIVNSLSSKLDSDDIDNPIYKVKKDIVIRDNIIGGAENQDTAKYFIDRLDQIAESVSQLATKVDNRENIDNGNATARVLDLRDSKKNKYVSESFWHQFANATNKKES